ncbi:hypothetical protein JCM8097_007458 [Rhodosporidiobolus ruineniae]
MHGGAGEGGVDALLAQQPAPAPAAAAPSTTTERRRRRAGSTVKARTDGDAGSPPRRGGGAGAGGQGTSSSPLANNSSSSLANSDLGTHMLGGTASPAPQPQAAAAPPVYRPASAKPPLSRIPTFPLVDAYVPDATSNDRRHPRQLVPKDLGFPTLDMHGRIRKEDLDDRLLMATCAVLHGFENRALCPKEVAEVMLERDWLKNAGTTPFAHVSTCIRSHVARAGAATPPYLPLLVPFELVGALTVEEVRAVGLHAEQRPAVKRGTLWYLNPQVFGPGLGADDPFVRCRREAGLAPSDRDGLYVRGLVPLQPAQPAIPPDLRMSSSIFHSNGADDHDGDEEGMGRGKRKRRASSAMMAAMSSTPAGPSPLSQSVGAASPATPGGAVASPLAMAIPTPTGGVAHRRTQSFAPSSAPARSGIPKLKLRLTALEENDSSVDDSDGHTGEAAERRRKNKKKVRRAGSEGLSRAGSAEPSVFGDEEDEDEDLFSSTSGFLPRGPSTYSSASSSALLAQSLLAASSPAAVIPRSHSHSSLAPHYAVSPDSLSLSTTTSHAAFPFALNRPAASAPLPLNLSMSAPNIFSHHFGSAASPPELAMDVDPASSSSSVSGAGAAAVPSGTVGAATPPSDAHASTDEDDFHEAMLRGDDLLDFEWGSESYTSAAGTAASSIEALAGAGAGAGAATPSLPVGALPALPGAKGEGKGKARAGSPPPTEEHQAVDTSATTPRSPGKELEERDAEPGEDVKQEEEVQPAPEPPVEIVPGPLGQISRVGMSTTLCGEMGPRDVEAEEDVVIVVEDEEGELGDVSQADVSLISLVHETPPSAKHSPHPDAAGLTAPPPSPLPLEFTSMGALTNAFAATDFDFVGHDEADGSPSFRGSLFSYSRHDDGDSADDEEEEDDDLVTIKIEEDAMAVSSAPSSRASSANPPSSAPQFDARLLASVRAGSTGSSSSDSDSFDPLQFVSAPLLATGLPVPQPAPSPPDTNDWAHSVDMLDDLENELAGVDLMAPESIGLDELDLAWAGDGDGDEYESHSPAPPPPSPSRPQLSVKRPDVAAFLTGSSLDPHGRRFTSPIPSPRRTSSNRVPLLADFAGKKGGASPVPPTLTRTLSSATAFSASGRSAAADDAECEDDEEDRDAAEGAEPSTPPPLRRTGRTRQPSAAVKAELENPTGSPRKSTRRAAAEAK